MLHEYAVAPEVIATWVDRLEGRYFIDKFGIGSPRIISRYPRKRWKKQVWNAWQARGPDSQRDRKRMEELIARLSHAMVQRLHATWEPGRSWTENAVEDHGRVPFYAILAADNALRNPSILVAGDVDDENRQWNLPRSQTIPRRSHHIADVMRDMLRAAADLLLIDPYFTPYRSDYLNVIGACVWASRECRTVAGPRVRIISAARGDVSEDRAYFKTGCEQHLPPVLPVGQEVTICRLSDRPGGEKLHNRYVLTEHGGVIFPAGLDEGKAGTTDDLALLEREPYNERWTQYAKNPPAFDRPEGEITVVGTGRSPQRAQRVQRHSTT